MLQQGRQFILRQSKSRALLFLIQLFIALIVSSSISFVVALAQEGEVDDETCLMCHDEYNLGLAKTTHRLSSDTKNAAVEIGCISCHEGGDVHAEDPSVENITNPANLSGLDAVKLCSQCHLAHKQMDNYGFDIHANQQLNCSQCHRVHGGSASQLLDERAEFCQKCHYETVVKFRRRSNHPVLQGNLTCLNCHRFTKRRDYNLMYELNRVCQDCHPEQGGPYLYEHDAVNAYSVESGSCIECHDPHGSENDHLLRQPGNQLCRQCHIEHITRNHNDLWDRVWSTYPCQFCHTDTHGSFASNLYLDPDLPTKIGGGDCYQSDCHSLNKQ